jgi:ankyrin repeat protein
VSDRWTIGAIDRTAFDGLYASMKHGSDAAVLEFLANGGDPNLRYSERGWTPLHAAAFLGRRAVVEALLAKGAEVDALTDPGFTPLATAAHTAHVGSVRLLLEAGASVDCRPLGMPLLESLKYAQRPSRRVREILSEAIASQDKDQPD